jgi:hypothetical protein
VSRRALRWAGGAVVVLAFVALLLSSLPLGDTLALFNGETQNAGSTFAGGWVGAATTPTVIPTGFDTALAWTPGTHGPVTGQQLFGVDNTTSSNCSGAAYAALATMATALTAVYTDASRANAGNNGDWFCYEMVSTSATVWTAATPFAALQIGLVANSLAMANVGTAGRFNANDTITVTFNQKPIIPAGAVKVCVVAPATIVIGDTTAAGTGSGNCAAGDAFNIGKVTLTGATIATTVKYPTSTFTLSVAAPWTLVVTLAGSGTLSTVTGTPTWKFTPASSILSTITTHQATICTAATANCQPSSTTNF